MQARLLQSTDEEDVQSSESESELDDEEDVKSDFEMGMRHRLAKGASVSIPKRALGPPSPKTRTARSGRGRRIQSRLQRSRSTSCGEDKLLRVSVYCLGEFVSCEDLLARLERGEVRRPAGPWVDTQMDCSVHSSLETVRARRPTDRPKEPVSAPDLAFVRSFKTGPHGVTRPPGSS